MWALLFKTMRVFVKGIVVLVLLKLAYLTWNIISSNIKQQKSTLVNKDDGIRTEKRSFLTNKTKCKIQKDVLFLKTHKTGSSTVTNILNRFAEKHKLRMAVPIDGLYNFMWPLPFNGDFVTDSSQPVNILSNHARFNNESFKKLMPLGAKYVTVFRNPATQFPSLFEFMNLGDVLKFINPSMQRKISLKHFLNNASYILQTLNKNNRQAFIDNPSLYLLRNPQLFDLGYEFSSDSKEGNKEYDVRKKIASIETTFDLVLIMEHFDESLVLLKRKWCWDLDDVTYFKHNQQKRTSTDKMSYITKEKLLNWTKADTMLYNHFYERFWIEIGKEGSDFWHEVHLLRRKNEEFARTCLSEDTVYDKPYAGSTATIYGHSLKLNIPTHMKRRCMEMTRSEMKYLDHFRLMYKNIVNR